VTKVLFGHNDFLAVQISDGGGRDTNAVSLVPEQRANVHHVADANRLLNRMIRPDEVGKISWRPKPSPTLSAATDWSLSQLTPRADRPLMNADTDDGCSSSMVGDWRSWLLASRRNAREHENFPVAGRLRARGHRKGDYQQRNPIRRQRHRPW